ncbi:5-oxopent-3-ene-1,2,5-tricarboxylate decarboxylase [Variovorax paradoxus]|jgi:2-keto-4-pentenoate hydratase/2-oxohepta-3-ene-1,7-dioic acid hydratase in catechol pathway|uniref:fumarylacetoacetate hydrolase family protein n=1 Tax=Variovorax paradoxus TaxID=34073 RepID=UPI0006E53F52|nr:5-oxopent-3-ene-1,2,5-tricarboxylate decarboxylase [Variovorax paradoxus]KPV11027.1 5-oxopent-3-ene-1,2,5-tricarboxylate decarboxylase [Variovorax paradoxus]KPV13466.1 5-oxopent-3-ene-1,2,5-tricarboxylate decarboxylase [Variovorax paradoxus]KPV24281.1 5-oxopent-3-ene-1,2,5-tricarboxylate decarboxylase [Variovorax paradoxus]KPV31592.1 5-oxopent-3-ene-1,2,5-tricarboxylate decarboxylase [Variovorax paradoxus]
MNFVTFHTDSDPTPRLGAVVDGAIVTLPGDMVALCSRGAAGFAAAAKEAASAPATARIPLDAARLLPVVPRPGKIICLGLNYADHAAEGGNQRPDYPSFFLRGASSLVAHGAAIQRPRVSSHLDFEAELAVVIGRTSRHLSEADALEAVAGYACFNDATLRDYQRKTAQWTIGKNFDATGALGPWLVPASELPPGAAGLKIESRLNGTVMQSSNTAQMLFPVAETLCLLTEALTLEPGDVIVMGTPAGVGYARKPPVWMKAGDTIEIEIEGIGVLSNPVENEAQP